MRREGVHETDQESTRELRVLEESSSDRNDEQLLERGIPLSLVTVITRKLYQDITNPCAVVGFLVIQLPESLWSCKWPITVGLPRQLGWNGCFGMSSSIWDE